MSAPRMSDTAAPPPSTEWNETDKKVYTAKVAEQAERYNEMVEAMEYVSKNKEGGLNVEERNLLSVAFKNVVGAKRASWRILQALEQRHASKKESEKETMCATYRKSIEVELKQTCDALLSLLEESLLNKESIEAEAKVFYLKMKGDYYRYIAEFAVGDDNKQAIEGANQAYKVAVDQATGDDGLKPTHPIRLGLALNYSVFYYEIMEKSPEACNLAKNAFDEAIAELDTLSEESYKDATLIMQLLRDNLTLWTSDTGGAGDGDAPADGGGDGTQVEDM